MLATQRRLQEVRYAFPYHHLPWSEGGAWHPGRTLLWGFEYLGLMEVVLEEVAACRPQRVMDFGCGDGRLLTELVRRGVRQVGGVDISERALAFARAFVDDPAVPLATHPGGLRWERCDVVVAMEVLEHVPDAEMDRLLGELRGLLPGHGRLIVSVPTTNVPLNPKHYRHYTREALETQVASHFAVTRVRYVHRDRALAILLRRLVLNRFVVVTAPAWLRVATRLYRRFVLHAAARDAAHLVAVLAPRR